MMRLGNDAPVVDDEVPSIADASSCSGNNDNPNAAPAPAIP